MMSMRGNYMSPLEHQQFQRLRVNRIAVIQELKVDHILHYLLAKAVLDDGDLSEIDSCHTTTDKSKRLLDILPTKGRASNWYKHFRAALLNPSVEDIVIKHRYQILVEFLDNTIIEQTGSLEKANCQTAGQQMPRFNKYQPLPDIANSASRPPTVAAAGHRPKTLLAVEAPYMAERAGSPSNIPENGWDETESAEKWTMRQLQGTKIPHTVQYWDEDPSGFSSVLEIPLQEIVKLEQSARAADLMLGEQERDAAGRMKQLEIAYYLWKNERANDEMVLCTCSAVLDIIQDVNNHFLHFKYFRCLSKDYDLDLALEIAYSYDEVTQWLAEVNDQETCYQLVDIGLNLISFVFEFGAHEIAWQVVASLEAFLKNHTDLWMLQFSFYVKCLSLSNSVCNLARSDEYYDRASLLRERISKAMASFGQETLDCSELFAEASILKRKLGDFGPSYTWAQKSMQDVDLEKKSILVNVLCTSSVAYANQWKLMRAEDLAVEAVQQARMIFGVYSPIYLQALKNFVAFSNNFRHDAFGVEASMAALNIANKLYGYESLHVAQAYAGHADALLAASNYDQLLFFDLAEKAYKVAADSYSPNHPLLIPYTQTLVKSLLCRARLTRSAKERQELLVWVEKEIRKLLRLCELHYGDVSQQTASAHLLEAEVFLAQDRGKDAEACFNMALNTMTMLTGEKHGDVQKIKFQLAMLAKASGDVVRAKSMLKKVVEGFDTAAYYMNWYNDAYEALISCCELTESQEQVKEFRSKHMGWKWISEDNRRNIMWRLLHAVPEGYDSFLEKFELWRSKVKKVQVHLEKLKNAGDLAANDISSS
ncbi:amyloid protein-binding protein 2-like [Watersipora subatra]|uniref:amyloid protein-binding protein 2-like n=1 Tax=Watersipora subatra TaxID=2589382 RepID=UPI00355B1931